MGRQRAVAILLTASMGSQNTSWQGQWCSKITCPAALGIPPFTSQGQRGAKHIHPGHVVDEVQHKDPEDIIALPSLSTTQTPTKAKDGLSSGLSWCVCLTHMSKPAVSPKGMCIGMMAKTGAAGWFRDQALWHHSSASNFPSPYPHFMYIY